MRWKSGLWVVVVVVLLLPAVLLAQTSCDEGAGPLDPAIPKDFDIRDVLQKISAHEARFKDALITYSFTQDVTVQTVLDVAVDGEFRRVSTISYPGGVRQAKVTFAPVNTLRRVSMSKEDFDEIDNPNPFLLTAQGMTEYNVLYAGRQKVDELETYVFDVTPKQILPERRYFQGRVWVEIHDVAVVKSCGKSVPEPKPKIEKPKRRLGRPAQNQSRPVPEQISPTFVTYRELIDGQYWFPTYIRSNENLQFNTSDPVRIREVIKYQNYKRGTPGGQPTPAKP